MSIKHLQDTKINDFLMWANNLRVGEFVYRGVSNEDYIKDGQIEASIGLAERYYGSDEHFGFAEMDTFWSVINLYLYQRADKSRYAGSVAAKRERGFYLPIVSASLPTETGASTGAGTAFS